MYNYFKEGLSKALISSIRWVEAHMVKGSEDYNCNISKGEVSMFCTFKFGDDYVRTCATYDFYESMPLWTVCDCSDRNVFCMHVAACVYMIEHHINGYKHHEAFCQTFCDQEVYCESGITCFKDCRG